MGMGGGRRKRRGDSPGSWRKRRGDDGSGDHLDAPPPKRSANNKVCALAPNPLHPHARCQFPRALPLANCSAKGHLIGAQRVRAYEDSDGWLDMHQREGIPAEGLVHALLQCEECGTTETPTWRRWGPTLLCNACGLRRKKNPKLQPPPKDAALPAEPPAQHSRDLSVQQSGEDVRSGDHSQLSHALAPPVHQ